MLIYIIVSVLIVSKYLQAFSKYERKTSVFSAAPGALGPLLILAEDEKSDLSQVATSHLIRLITAFAIEAGFTIFFFCNNCNIDEYRWGLVSKNEPLLIN